MSKWILKAVVQKAISFLPGKERINHLFQKHVTKGVELTDQHLTYKLEAGRDHIHYFDKYAATARDQAEILELGTGWYPIVPLLFYLGGFGAVTSIDIRNWQSRERHLTALRRIMEYYDAGKLQAYCTTIVPSRLAELRALLTEPEHPSTRQINERIHLDTKVMDATRLSFPDDRFDMVCSNNTFEHIPAGVLEGILREFQRVVRPKGVMSHFIDLSDHFAHMDRSISIYNFLKFSERRWQFIDNDIQPQNRLRWKDYLAMYERLNIDVREQNYRKGSPEMVAGTRVHREFAGYTEEELAISHGYIVS